MALHKALWLSLVVPDPNISFKWFWTSSTIGSGIHLNHSLKGVLSVTFILCSVEWVQPNSAGSIENMLWYSAWSQQAVSASYGAHKSRPLKSNLSNNLPCLCLTVSLEEWESGDLSAPFCNCSPSGDLGTGNAATTLATGVFFWRVLQVGSIVPYLYNCFLTAFP